METELRELFSDWRHAATAHDLCTTWRWWTWDEHYMTSRPDHPMVELEQMTTERGSLPNEVVSHPHIPIAHFRSKPKRKTAPSADFLPPRFFPLVFRLEPGVGPTRFTFLGCL